MASTLSSTAIRVSWDPPPNGFLYGVLRSYEIRYTPDGGNAIVITGIPAENSTHVLTGLQEFVNYSIEVTAVTVGAGPYSYPVVAQTDTHTVPGDVPRPPEVPPEGISATGAILAWSRPTDPNGIITGYTVNVLAVESRSSQPGSPTRRRQVGGVVTECAMGMGAEPNQTLSVPGTQTFTVVSNLGM